MTRARLPHELPEIKPRKYSTMPRGTPIDGPYDPAIGIIDHGELVRRLLPLSGKQIAEIAAMARVERVHLYKLRQGFRKRPGPSPELRRRISQAILRLDREREQALPAPSYVGRVLFSPSGRAIIQFKRPSSGPVISVFEQDCASRPNPLRDERQLSRKHEAT